MTCIEEFPSWEPLELAFSEPPMSGLSIGASVLELLSVSESLDGGGILPLAFPEWAVWLGSSAVPVNPPGFDSLQAKAKKEASARMLEM